MTSTPRPEGESANEQTAPLPAEQVTAVQPTVPMTAAPMTATAPEALPAGGYPPAGAVPPGGYPPAGSLPLAAPAPAPSGRRGPWLIVAAVLGGLLLVGVGFGAGFGAGLFVGSRAADNGLVRVGVMSERMEERMDRLDRGTRPENGRGGGNGQGGDAQGDDTQGDDA